MNIESTNSTASLTIITERQSRRDKAEKLAEMLLIQLGGICTLQRIERYTKFDNSYKIVFELTFDNNLNRILQSIALTDSIVSPWIIYYDNQEDTVKLIFNTSDSVRYRRIEYNVITWGHLQF
jgi:hypothetical protein